MAAWHARGRHRHSSRRNIALLQTSISDYATVDSRDPTQGSSEATLLKDGQNASNCVVFHNGSPAPDMNPLNRCTDPTLFNGEPRLYGVTLGDRF